MSSSPNHRSTLFVRFRQEGFHHWPGAPARRYYLSKRHRHLFHIQVEVSAPVDGERAVEFHDLLTRSQTVMRDVAQRGTMYEYGDWSCEQIADAMARRLAQVYKSVVGVTVSEDGECGAIVYADAEADEPMPPGEYSMIVEEVSEPCIGRGSDYRFRKIRVRELNEYAHSVDWIVSEAPNARWAWEGTVDKFENFPQLVGRILRFELTHVNWQGQVREKVRLVRLLPTTPDELSDEVS